MIEQSQPTTTPPPAESKPADKGKAKKQKKAKAPKFDEKRELALRTERLIELAPKIRKAEDNLLAAADAHKDAKSRLESVQNEASAIIYELESIRKGTFQSSLPMDLGEKKEPSQHDGKALPVAGFDKLDSELRLAAEDALNAARFKKKGLSPMGLALSLFGGKRATKDQKARALEILTLMAAAGLVEQTESEKKEQTFWPVSPKEAKEEAAEAAGGK